MSGKPIAHTVTYLFELNFQPDVFVCEKIRSVMDLAQQIKNGRRNNKSHFVCFL